ncbi:hypothetical protein N9D73_01475 [Planktomarina temperata]|nr:hypothetical protein [Planktomarina temperata]
MIINLRCLTMSALLVLSSFQCVNASDGFKTINSLIGASQVSGTVAKLLGEGILKGLAGKAIDSLFGLGGEEQGITPTDLSNIVGNLIDTQTKVLKEAINQQTKELEVNAEFQSLSGQVAQDSSRLKDLLDVYDPTSGAKSRYDQISKMLDHASELRASLQQIITNQTVDEAYPKSFFVFYGQYTQFANIYVFLELEKALVNNLMVASNTKNYNKSDGREVAQLAYALLKDVDGFWYKSFPGHNVFFDKEVSQTDHFGCVASSQLLSQTGDQLDMGSYDAPRFDQYLRPLSASDYGGACTAMGFITNPTDYEYLNPPATTFSLTGSSHVQCNDDIAVKLLKRSQDIQTNWSFVVDSGYLINPASKETFIHFFDWGRTSLPGHRSCAPYMPFYVAHPQSFINIVRGVNKFTLLDYRSLRGNSTDSIFELPSKKGSYFIIPQLDQQAKTAEQLENADVQAYHFSPSFKYPQIRRCQMSKSFSLYDGYLKAVLGSDFDNRSVVKALKDIVVNYPGGDLDDRKTAAESIYNSLTTDCDETIKQDKIFKGQ